MPIVNWDPRSDGKSDIDVNVTGGAITATIGNNVVPVSGVILNTVNTNLQSVAVTVPVSGVVTIKDQPVRVDTGLTSGGAVPTSGIVTNTVKTTIENTPTFLLGGQPIATTTTVEGQIVVSGLKLSGGSFYIIQDAPISGVMTNSPSNPGNVQIQGTPNVNISSTSNTLPVSGVVHILGQPIMVDSELIIDQTLPVSGVILNTVSTTATIINTPHVVVDSLPNVNINQPLTAIIPSGVTINALPAVSVGNVPTVVIQNSIPAHTVIVPSGVTVNALPNVTLNQPITAIVPSGLAINSIPSVAVNSLPNVTLNQPITSIIPSGITINALPSVIIGNVPTVNVNQPITAIVPSGLTVNALPAVTVSSLPNVTLNQPITAIVPSGISTTVTNTPNVVVTTMPPVTISGQPITTLTTLVPSTSVQVSGVVQATALDGTNLLPYMNEGFQHVPVHDLYCEDLLVEVIKQLKIMNLHLSLMTDNFIRREDIDDTD